MPYIQAWEPNIIVGIDFGMTCTAVAYSEEPEWYAPWCIQRWPRPLGTDPGKLSNKVITHVGYDEHERLCNWGFLSGADGKRITLEKEFKLYIDPMFWDDNPHRPAHPEAMKFYKDYMTSLHNYIEQFFSQSIVSWHQKNVEYLFSIPTTWKNPNITANLEATLAAAGFANGHNRRVNIYLTEAESAAVNAAKSFRVGDIVMVADAGGATTDINVLELIERSARSTKLRALTKAEGINVGSTVIDSKIRRLIAQRLRALGVPGDNADLQWIADDMMHAKGFEGTKCGFAGEQWRVQMNTQFTIPTEVAPNLHDRQVIVTGVELKEAFDLQIRLMMEKIDEQRIELTRQRPRDMIKYLVLSGGLGSSPYVQNELRARYANFQILCTLEPQLAVAKGLVIDRVQALREGTGVYTGKCSRVSYGVLCRRPYNKDLHRGEPMEKDPLDKIIYAKEQVDWLIREGAIVPDEGFSRTYRLKIPRGQESQSFEAQFVMSEAPAHDLPRSLRRGHVQRLCTVRARFRDNERFIEKRGSIWPSSRHQHLIIDFKLKVIVGSTDLKFEIVSMDGVKYDQNAASVRVEWQKVALPVEEPLAAARTFYPIDH